MFMFYNTKKINLPNALFFRGLDDFCSSNVLCLLHIGIYLLFFITPTFRHPGCFFLAKQ